MSLSLLFFYVCVLTVGHSNNNIVADEFVDLIELNHFFDQQGRHVYDQVIFYEQSPDTGRYGVRAWCLVEDRESLSRRPIRNPMSGLYQVDWFDTDQRLLRRITSKLYRESWTQIDPERANKKILDERLRTSLVQSPKRLKAELRNQVAESDQDGPLSLLSSQNVAVTQTRNPIAQ